MKTLPQLTLNLNVDHEQLQSSFTRYLTQYRQGKLKPSDPDVKILASEKSQQVFQTWFNQNMQPDHTLIFELGGENASRWETG